MPGREGIEMPYYGRTVISEREDAQMSRFICMLAMIIVWGSAGAAEAHWLKKDNPENLPTYVQVESACSFTEPSVRKIVERLLLLGRLQTEDFGSSTEPLGLYISVNCVKPIIETEKGQLVQVDIYFMRHVPELGRKVLEARPYGFYGRNQPTEVLERLRAAVEDALAEYIQVNFDLAHD